VQSVNKINLPLVLISQIQRSGGTLLSQLFDGHSECCVHPEELHIGYPRKEIWPIIQEESSCLYNFDILREEIFSKLSRDGYKKSVKSIKMSDRIPFLFLGDKQNKVFEDLYSEVIVKSKRDIFNIYFTSFFNAWEDDRNRGGDKRIVLGFVPRMSMLEKSMEGFYNVYPDGKLISIIREPFGWYSSVRKYYGRYKSIKYAEAKYKSNIMSIINNKKRFKDNMFILDFKDLILHTEIIMKELCCFLGLTFENIMFSPTFNKQNIMANSSYSIKEFGISKAPISKRRKYKIKNKEDRQRIDHSWTPLYLKVCKCKNPLNY